LTGNLYLDLAISLAGISFIVGVSWFLGAMKTARLTEEALRRRAALDEPDLVIERLLISDDGRSGVALSAEEAFLMTVVGDGFTTRRSPISRLEMERAGSEVVLRLPGGGIAPLRLRLEGQSGAVEALCALEGRTLE
jgi:hypothetical protein